MGTRSTLDYRGKLAPVWCAYCGDYAVLSALYRAFSTMDIPPEEIVVVSGIGCSGRLPHFVNAYGFHGVHGRVLPTAIGIKAANPSLTVLAVGGDGDGMGIGAGHFIHAARKNPNITYIMMDNGLYGQTKGQASPTSCLVGAIHELPLQGPSTPYGLPEEPINPIALAISTGATFVARGYSGSSELLVDLIVKGIEHKGFSFIQVLSPCVTFSRLDPYKTISQASEPIKNHNIVDKAKALELSWDEEKILLGVFYQLKKPTFEEGLDEMKERAKRGGKGDLRKLMEQFLNFQLTIEN